MCTLSGWSNSYFPNKVIANSHLDGSINRRNIEDFLARIIHHAKNPVILTVALRGGSKKSEVIIPQQQY